MFFFLTLFTCVNEPSLSATEQSEAHGHAPVDSAQEQELGESLISDQPSTSFKFVNPLPKDPDERVMALVENHHSDISQTLAAMVKGGDFLVISKGLNDGAKAMFTAVPNEHLTLIGIYDDIRTPIVPMIVLNSKNVGWADDELEQRILQLVLYHEYQHFKQWKALGSPRWHGFVFDPYGEMITDVEDCKGIWKTENEAYTAECRLNKQWGGDVWVSNYCEHVDKDWSAFDNELFKAMVHANQGASCESVWASLRR